MKYVFLKDFGGTETGERRYVKGQVVEHVRSDFVARGIVALVPEPEPVLVPEPEPVSEVTPFVITKRHKRGRSK
jgi:hypothetical protein